MRIRRHLSYANVTATVALFFALGGGAYAVTKVNSRDIANDSIRSVDLKDRKAVKAKDVKRNGLTGRQISETTLNAKFAPIVGDETVDCNPSSTTLVNCVSATLAAQTAVACPRDRDWQAGERRWPGQRICEVRIDDEPAAVGVEPGEETSDNTSGAATNGFARTVVTRDRSSPGAHRSRSPVTSFSGNVRIDAPTIAAIAIGSR